MVDGTTYLNGKLLLAMPQMGDSRFQKAVIFMCAHDAAGAMGIVINNPLPGVDFQKLLSQLNVGDDAPGFRGSKLASQPVFSGGPVEGGRGFVLHSADFTQADTVRVNHHFGVTGTIDALREIVHGRGPQQMIFALGYAGWSAGQLEREMHENAWLVVDPTPDLVFGVGADGKWDRAVNMLGIDPAMLSGDFGRA